METCAVKVPQVESTTLGQLVISHPSATAIFEKYELDYCCGGNKTLEEACREKGLDRDRVLAEIQVAPKTGALENFHPELWDSSFLVDYIVQNHHQFLRGAMPELEALLNKVCARHGADYAKLLEIRDCFADLSEELTSHMNKEEIVLFPAIKGLESAQAGTHTVSLRAPIQVMEHEHESAGNLVRKIKTLSDNYSPPDFACPTLRLTFQRLQEFEADLVQHIHLENNILFKRFVHTESFHGSCSIS